MTVGAEAVEVSSQPGGYSPSLAASCRLGDGRRIFAKAAATAHARRTSPEVDRRGFKRPHGLVRITEACTAEAAGSRDLGHSESIVRRRLEKSFAKQLITGEADQPLEVLRFDLGDRYVHPLLSISCDVESHAARLIEDLQDS